MKKSIAMLAAMMMAAAGGGREYYDLPPSMTEEQRKRRAQYLKERAHKLNPVDLSEREFVIKGEVIVAHDKKTAMKIYANRHPESKKRKKK